MHITSVSYYFNNNWQLALDSEKVIISNFTNCTLQYLYSWRDFSTVSSFVSHNLALATASFSTDSFLDFFPSFFPFFLPSKYHKSELRRSKNVWSTEIKEMAGKCS